MRKMILTALLLLFILLLANAQQTEVNYEQKYFDVVSRNYTGDAADRQAIRLYECEQGWEVAIIGDVDVSLAEVARTIEKAPCGLRLQANESHLYVEPDGLDRAAAFDLLTTLIYGDYALLFFRYVRRS